MITEQLQPLIVVDEMRDAVDVLGNSKAMGDHLEWLPELIMQSHPSETSGDSVLSPVSASSYGGWNWETLGSHCPAGVDKAEFCHTLLKTLTHTQHERICECESFSLCTHKLGEAEAVAILYYLLRENGRKNSADWEDQAVQHSYQQRGGQSDALHLASGGKRRTTKSNPRRMTSEGVRSRSYPMESIDDSREERRRVTRSILDYDGELDTAMMGLLDGGCSIRLEDNPPSCTLHIVQEPCIAQLRSKPEKNYMIRPPPKIEIIGKFDPHVHKLACTLIDSRTGEEVICGGMQVLEGNVLDLTSKRHFMNHIATFPELRIMVKPSLMGASNGHLRFKFQLIRHTEMGIRVERSYLLTTIDVTVYSNYTQMSKLEKEIFMNANQKRKNPISSPCVSAMNEQPFHSGQELRELC